MNALQCIGFSRRPGHAALRVDALEVADQEHAEIHARRRCSDSLSLRDFLGIPIGEDSPDHSSLSYIRNRLPLDVHEAVFVWVLALLQKKKLLQGKTVGVDSTTLEADAAMKSIVRKETGSDMCLLRRNTSSNWSSVWQWRLCINFVFNRHSTAYPATYIAPCQR